MNKLGGTLTRKKKQPSVPPEEKQRAEEAEIEQIENEGREAIDSHLRIRQPDLSVLEDGLFCTFHI